MSWPNCSGRRRACAARGASETEPGHGRASVSSEPVAWFPQGRFLIEAAGSTVARPGALCNTRRATTTFRMQVRCLRWLCAARPGEWVCDTCAAPGGKSTGLLEQLGERRRAGGQ
ncbi:MAG: hypothetical protein R3C56_07410 [Pirellulaceae bacterium]